MKIRDRLLVVACMSAACSLPVLAADGVAPLGGGLSSLEAKYPGVATFERGGRIVRVYGRDFSHGRSAVESARSFVAGHTDIFGVPSEHLVPIGPFEDGRHVQPLVWQPESDSYKFSLVCFTQQVNGYPVFRSSLRLLVRNEPGYPLVLASVDLRDLGDFAATINAAPTSPARLDPKVFAREVMKQYRDQPAIQSPEMVIWAGYDEMADDPRIAVSFIVERGTRGVDHQKFLYVTDATTGEILFEEDQILHADVVATVNGMATIGWAADACGAELSRPLPYARVTVGSSSYIADVNGQVTIPNSGSGSVSASASVDGLYFVTTTQQGTDETGSASIPSGGSGTISFNAANTDAFQRAAVNAYNQANVARDYTLAYNPDYPTVAGQTGFQVNVNIASSCNAYYDGPSINFYAAGGGCNNTAFSVVVHHEYGHHLVATGGSGQGAYGEGMGDVIGVLISDTSQLAIGFSSCSSGIRDADNTCQYSSSGCSSCGSEIHACGQLISGCVWSTRSYLIGAGFTDYRDILSSIAINSIPLHTGTSIASDITIDFLTLDDDDADLGNGGPHYTQINQGFTAHGLPGPAISLLNITHPAPVPTLVDPSGSTVILTDVAPLAAQPMAGTGRLHWRVGTGTWQSMLMTQTSPNHYTVNVPATACGSAISYYFSANTTTGTSVVSPTGAPASFHAAVSATDTVLAVNDTCETNTGWVVGATGDSATAGIWVRVDPTGTSAQPEDDHTASGTICWVTGQHTSGGAGSNDVDGGVTSLLSPIYDMSGLAQPTISFWLWYSNDQGGGAAGDTFPIQISNNGGTSWVALETIPTTGSTNAWVFKSYSVAQFVTPTNAVRLRFQAQDTGTGSLVEAAIDDLQVVAYDCAAPGVPGDLDGDGDVDGSDLAALLSAWGTAGGDVDGNGSTDGADLSIQLSNWG